MAGNGDAEGAPEGPPDDAPDYADTQTNSEAAQPEAIDLTGVAPAGAGGDPCEEGAVEMCTCVVGDSQACDTHPGRDGNGICRAGTRTCLLDPNGTTAQFWPVRGLSRSGAVRLMQCAWRRFELRRNR